MTAKLTPVFTPPYDEWTPCIISEGKTATRNTQPVMKDDPNTEARFHQELNNSYVRNRTYTEGVEKGDLLFEDAMIQLKAAQETAVFFENESRINKADSDMWYQYYLDAVKSRGELRAENDRLKKGFWKRFANWFFNEDASF